MIPMLRVFFKENSLAMQFFSLQNRSLLLVAESYQR